MLERAGFRCEYVRQDTGLPWCHTISDHIHPGVNGVYDDSLDNLQALCVPSASSLRVRVVVRLLSIGVSVCVRNGMNTLRSVIRGTVSLWRICW